MIECIRVLSKWTLMIYEQITMKIKKNNAYNTNYDFFRAEQCLSFERFNSSMDSKKNSNIPAKILFGRQLMSIPGVTDFLASAITEKYPTMKCLYNAWDGIDDEQKAKNLLYE